MREWFYDGLAKIGFLKMFYKFEDFEEKDNPIDELIKDDVTMVKFSKAFKEYKSQKDKNKRLKQEPVKKL